MKKTKQEKNSLIKIVDFIDFNQEIIEDDKTFEKIMFIYSIAIKELKTKIEILQEESKIFNKYDLIDHINTRVKTPKSIIQKMKKKECTLTYQEMINNINDIAGVRIICPIKKDIYDIKKLVEQIPGIKVLKEKDYVTHPKKSGYSSYHLIVEVPITLLENIIYVKVEIQIRTMAMDFWASLEHKAKYKSEIDIDQKTSKEWEKYAKIISKLDNQLYKTIAQ